MPGLAARAGLRRRQLGYRNLRPVPARLLQCIHHPGTSPNTACISSIIPTIRPPPAPKACGLATAFAATVRSTALPHELAHRGYRPWTGKPPPYSNYSYAYKRGRARLHARSVLA